MTPTRQTKGCVGCIYYSQRTNSCDYILVENNCRNAPAIRGKGCKKKKKEGVRNVDRRPIRPQGSTQQPNQPERVFPADKARELYDKGLSDVKIGEAIGWSAFSVGKWRRKNELPCTTELGRRPAQLEEYKDGVPYRMWQDGANDAEIGRAVGVNKSAIANWRARNRLPSNLTRDKKKNHQEVSGTEKEEPMEEKMNEQATDKLATEETVETPKSGATDTPVAPDAPSCERVAEELAWIWKASTGEECTAEKAASLLELVDIAWRIAAGDCRGAIQRVLSAERRSRA